MAVCPGPLFRGGHTGRELFCLGPALTNLSVTPGLTVAASSVNYSCRGVLSLSSSFCFSPSLFIYLFLAALGPHCWARAFFSCGEWGLLLVAVRGLQ